MKLEIIVQGLLFTAYKDYIGARVLINNKLIIQGLTLASSAIEKYIKAYLVAVGKKPRWVHLDNVNELKKQFGTAHIDVFNALDPAFLSILGKAYAYRYLDQKVEVDYIGVAINQFLAELDYIVDYFEEIIEMYDPDTDLRIDSGYHMAVKAKEGNIIQNNFLHEGVTKREFMERPMVLYSLRINPGKNLDE
jgi:hypothetical protein